MNMLKEQIEFNNWINEESDAFEICACGHLMSEHNDKGCFYHCPECSIKDVGSNEFDGAIEEPFFSRPSI